jgi:peptidylprolyl isomerase
MKIILILILVASVYFIIQRVMNNPAASKENNQIGSEFLEKNKLKEGVKTTESGLQHETITTGTETIHPKPSDSVTVHYHGTLIDGTVFDSSVERGEPATFPLNRVIKGWTEGLQLMVVGDKTRFYIPSNLAYGNQSMGKIAGGSMLTFDVELLAIN